MLNDFNCSCPIYIACWYTDLHRGIDGLASMPYCLTTGVLFILRRGGFIGLICKKCAFISI